ncbi:MAG: hypothetical protein NY202_02100 [Mollicutes bacterium UO1]
MDKYENNLKVIIEGAKELFSISSNLEEKDLEELQRLYNKHIIELGEKVKILETKLEIRKLFKEIQEEKQLLQVQIVGVDN